MQIETSDDDQQPPNRAPDFKNSIEEFREFSENVSENEKDRSTSSALAESPPVGSLKRKYDVFDNFDSITKRAKTLYNDKYRQLFNHTISELQRKEAPGRFLVQDLLVGQWSPEEKSLFFNALERWGQNNVKAIASVVERSEVEVTEYLHFVRHGNFNPNTLNYFRYMEEQRIPAARELSEECVSALDAGADSLRLFEYTNDLQQAFDRFGECAVLNEETVTKLDIARDEKDSRGPASLDKRPIKSPPVPSALAASVDLFNLGNWLELSKQVFMNRGDLDEEDHWLNLAHDYETPSIFASALNDFYNLTVSFTNRLIRATLFQTMSRLRAEDWPGIRERKRQVRRKDVLAALDVLNLVQDSKSFWTGTPRRLGLKVHNPVIAPKRFVHARNIGDELSYDEVERVLLAEQEDFEPHIARESIEQDQAQDTEDSIELQQDISLLIHYNDAANQKEHTQALVDEAKDKYTNAFDEAQDREEETRLWDLLGRSPPPNMAIPEKVSSLTRPRGLVLRGHKGESDWRDHVDYKSEWERYGYFVPEADFELEFGAAALDVDEAVAEAVAKAKAKSADDKSSQIEASQSQPAGGSSSIPSAQPLPNQGNPQRGRGLSSDHRSGQSSQTSSRQVSRRSSRASLAGSSAGSAGDESAVSGSASTRRSLPRRASAGTIYTFDPLPRLDNQGELEREEDEDDSEDNYLDEDVAGSGRS